MRENSNAPKNALSGYDILKLRSFKVLLVDDLSPTLEQMFWWHINQYLYGLVIYMVLSANGRGFERTKECIVLSGHHMQKLWLFKVDIGRWPKYNYTLIPQWHCVLSVVRLHHQSVLVICNMMGEGFFKCNVHVAFVIFFPAAGASGRREQNEAGGHGSRCLRCRTPSLRGELCAGDSRQSSSGIRRCRFTLHL